MTLACPRSPGKDCIGGDSCHGVSMLICKRAQECVFCRIVDGHEDASIKHIERGIVIIEPLNPVTPGHLLVIPTSHVEDFRTDPRVTGAAAMVAASFANEVYGDQDVNLLTSAGANATQTVFHLHWHLVPRFDGDGLQLPWTGRRAQAEAWTQGFLAAHYNERGGMFQGSFPEPQIARLGDGRLDLPVPRHLTEDVPYWNPFDPCDVNPLDAVVD